MYACVLKRQGKGSHEIWQSPDGNTFPMPHPKKNLRRGIVNKILKQAGIKNRHDM
ncbi:type II toxin-antitoxin system HicA family toxin [Algicola sagamiensis]|uniref:type II toxin-antitoxin system HicA family toxin n=1 Tax=Algicola sagamiensis TaxID=163869 RepID=UPI0003A56A62|nr:type II toxin-antitoxin system HicA family toxin [Algicola sagamiensis]